MQLLNENKLDEMCEIMDRLQEYVPKASYLTTTTLPSGETYTYKKSDMYEIILGGDQLTCARARESAAIRCSHHNDKDRLKGIMPVAEDWHTRQTLLKVRYYYTYDIHNIYPLLKVIWKYLYHSNSSREKGTLRQMKNFINWSSVPNMKGAEDFLELVLNAHVIICARHIIDSGKSGSVQEIANMLVEGYVKIDDKMKTASKDQIYLYACEIITLGLFWKNYHDACKEGDGERIMLIWKYLIIILKLSSRKTILRKLFYFCYNAIFYSQRGRWLKCFIVGVLIHKVNWVIIIIFHVTYTWST